MREHFSDQIKFFPALVSVYQILNKTSEIHTWGVEPGTSVYEPLGSRLAVLSFFHQLCHFGD